MERLLYFETKAYIFRKSGSVIYHDSCILTALVST